MAVQKQKSHHFVSDQHHMTQRSTKGFKWDSDCFVQQQQVTLTGFNGFNIAAMHSLNLTTKDYKKVQQSFRNVCNKNMQQCVKNILHYIKHF